MTYWRHSGKYTVVGKKVDELNKLDGLLQSLYQALQPALRDIDNDPPSAAYNAWFTDMFEHRTDRSNIPFVKKVLTGIATGASLLSGDFTYSQGGSPVFMSITEHGMFSANLNGKQTDLWDLYLEDKTKTASHVQDTPYLIIYPNFWNAVAPQMYGDLPPAPHGTQLAGNCLGINSRTNRFILNDALHWGSNLLQYRTWVLMEEVVHYQTWNAHKVSNDVQNANLLYIQKPAVKINTAQAYMYYAAFIYGNCTQFPRLDRELLEVDPPKTETDAPSTVTTIDGTNAQVLGNETAVEVH
ncbi:MAG: hypothetical protein Q9218_005010 [Villophora microphyllina]